MPLRPKTHPPASSVGQGLKSPFPLYGIDLFFKNFIYLKKNQSLHFLLQTKVAGRHSNAV